jgi:hypothetical protein
MLRWLSLLIFAFTLPAQSIMPDASFKGWTRQAWAAETPLTPVSQWKVDPATGVLVCEGNGGHEWLRYDRELADFLFHVEWRFTPIPDGKGYNSGVFVRTSADRKVWHQAQIGSLGGGFLFGATPDEAGVSQRFNLRDAMKEMRVKEAGEWNVYDITCRGQRVELSVNGGVTSAIDRCLAPKGHVGLEAEGYRIEFRKLEIKPLR